MNSSGKALFVHVSEPSHQLFSLLIVYRSMQIFSSPEEAPWQEPPNRIIGLCADMGGGIQLRHTFET